MSRILTKKDIRAILEERFEGDNFKTLSSLPPPKLFKDIEKASKRVYKAIKDGEKITIVGDYDVDGVVSTTILNDFLKNFTEDVEVVIPNRFSDGYGVSEEIIDRVDSSLVITVDNGISAVNAAKKAKDKGIDLIITDHHNIPEILPEAYAIVNPKQKDCDFPYKEICGAQVTWYLIAAVKNEMGVEFNLLKYIDLLSVAVIADMMELKEFNRVMVKRGLKEINSFKRASWVAIKEAFKKEFFVSEDISYLLAPLLNSAGRLKSADLAFEFLNSKTVEESNRYLDKIISLNEERKSIEKRLFKECIKDIDEKKSIIIVWGKEWHEGVVGIVAARLARRYKKPAIVLSLKDGIAKGSARSFGSINILSLIKEAKEYLLGFGGHAGAAGVKLCADNLDNFKDILEKEADKLDKRAFIPAKEILGEIDAREIDFELLEILEEYEPYGQNNPKPVFMIKNARIKKTRVLGKENSHQKLIIESKNSILESIDFNYENLVKNGMVVDMVFTVSKNSYRGYITPQLLIEEIRL